MKIFIAQLYVKAGVSFPFSVRFQQHWSKELTSKSIVSAYFKRRYGDNCDLVFRMSAKTGIDSNEIRGPTVFKRSNSVEYSIFLPFDVITQKKPICATALTYLFDGILHIMAKLEIDVTSLLEQKSGLIESTCADETMFVRD